MPKIDGPFWVVLVFVYSKGAVVRTKMPLEVARTTHMVCVVSYFKVYPQLFDLGGEV